VFEATASSKIARAASVLSHVLSNRANMTQLRMSFGTVSTDLRRRRQLLSSSPSAAWMWVNASNTAALRGRSIA